MENFTPGSAGLSGLTRPPKSGPVTMRVQATFHRWRKKYGGMSSSDAKRLKELEKENARLKKLLAEKECREGVPRRSAEKELDIDLLKEVSRGNF